MTGLDLLSRWPGHPYFIGYCYTLFPLDIKQRSRHFHHNGQSICFPLFHLYYFLPYKSLIVALSSSCSFFPFSLSTYVYPIHSIPSLFFHFCLLPFLFFVFSILFFNFSGSFPLSFLFVLLFYISFCLFFVHFLFV